MSEYNLTRRAFFRSGGTAVALGATAAGSIAAGSTAAGSTAAGTAAATEKATVSQNEKLHQTTTDRIGLNCSILLGYNLPLEKELEFVYQGGFRYVEIWVDHLRKYQSSGKSLSDLRKWLKDHNLQVVNGIGFARWSVDDEGVRKTALIQLQEEMNLLAELNCPYLAAPIMGITSNDSTAKIPILADRYRTILEIGRQTNVHPILEHWGPTPIFCALALFAAIAFAAHDNDAAMLLDAYHLHRGGNSYEGLNLLAGNALPIFHINDYPQVADRTTLKDSDRVFPGDGVCPLKEILTTLRRNGFTGVLSLELFNREYQKAMKPQELVDACYRKMTRLISA